MTYCRKLCRKPDQHLQQISNRRAEDCQVNRSKVTDRCTFKFIGRHSKGPMPPIDDDSSYIQYRKVVKGAFQIFVLQQDNTIILANGSICLVKNIIDISDNGCYVLVKPFTKVENVYDLPCSSSEVGVFLCSRLSNAMYLIRHDEIEAKCFRMPYWQNIPTKYSSPTHCMVVKIMSSHQPQT